MSAGELSFHDPNLLSHHAGLKRAAPSFISKREDDKPAHMFVGRRSDADDLMLDDMYTDSNDLDKRAHMFIGKRNRMFVGKRFDDSDFLSADKRAHLFIGKRQDEEESELQDLARLLEMESSKRAPMFVGKREGFEEDEEDKRAHMFIGKKLAPSFVGKRRVPGFIGRRQAPSFIGKRDTLSLVKRSTEESNTEEH
jgi:hypothetical protein